ncbi:uncharacterized protein LOC134224340 [Armigeres subalbatus]|uniref:uncharacterized protein LOC134224340 n=1 Tax=Armigeres subalbatus TaxID=124917 RepID=UPI002ED1C53D
MALNSDWFHPFHKDCTVQDTNIAKSQGYTSFLHSATEKGCGKRARNIHSGVRTVRPTAAPFNVRQTVSVSDRKTQLIEFRSTTRGYFETKLIKSLFICEPLYSIKQ